MRGLGTHIPVAVELGILPKAEAPAEPEEVADGWKLVGEGAGIGTGATTGEARLIKQPLAHHDADRYSERSWDGRGPI